MQFEQVVGGGDELPFGSSSVESAAAVVGPRSCLMSPRWADGVLPFAVEGLLTVRSRCSIAWDGVAPCGGGPVVVPLSRSAWRCLCAGRGDQAARLPVGVVAALVPLALLRAGSRRAAGSLPRRRRVGGWLVLVRPRCPASWRVAARAPSSAGGLGVVPCPAAPWVGSPLSVGALRVGVVAPGVPPPPSPPLRLAAGRGLGARRRPWGGGPFARAPASLVPVSACVGGRPSLRWLGFFPGRILGWAPRPRALALP